jgi:hypothetical protein
LEQACACKSARTAAKRTASSQGETSRCRVSLFFYNRFLNSSLISRFPIYRGFARFGEIESPARCVQSFPAIFLTCDRRRRNRKSGKMRAKFSRQFLFKRCRRLGCRAPCVFCADFNISVYGEKIEMDFAGEVVCSRKANPITKQ